jgi:hypothetical protein
MKEEDLDIFLMGFWHQTFQLIFPHYDVDFEPKIEFRSVIVTWFSVTNCSAGHGISVFYGTRWFLTAFKRIRHWYISWATWVQSTPSEPTSLSYMLTPSSHLCLGLKSKYVSYSYKKICICMSEIVCVCNSFSLRHQEIKTGQ